MSKRVEQKSARQLTKIVFSWLQWALEVRIKNFEKPTAFSVFIRFDSNQDRFSLFFVLRLPNSGEF